MWKAVEVALYDGTLFDQTLQDGWMVLTEHPTGPCGMRASICLTEDVHCDVRFQAVGIGYGGTYEEFATRVVLCEDAGLRYTSNVSK